MVPGSNPPEAYWNQRWSHKDYKWPVVDTPTTLEIDSVCRRVINEGGRSNEEAHADRGVMMEFPNGVAGTKIRKQQERCECRRRALVTLVDVPEEPLKVCVICDSAYLWPALT